MKNKFLFLSATALLSAGALIANADTVSQDISNAAQFDMNVKFVQAITLTQAEPFNFGTIINPEVGQRVDFSGAGGCLAVMVPNNETMHTAGRAVIIPGSGNRARLTVSGLSGFPTTDRTKFSLVFSSDSVKLKNSNDEECGEAKQFNDAQTFASDDLFNDFVTNNRLCPNATFEITNVPTGTTSCTGENTVTLVYSIDR